MRQGISSTNDAHFCFRALFILIFLVTSTQCQRRGFSHRRHYHHRPPPPHSLPPIFPPQQQPFLWHQHYTRNHVLQQEAIITNSNCPFVHINRVIADEGWYGMLSLESQFSANNISIEIQFDDFVVAFVVESQYL
jgi:hypothetical protein